MDTNLGIDAIMTELVAVEDAAKEIKKVIANGNNVFADLGVVIDMLGEFGDFSAAVKQAKDVMAEAKDLDADEVATIMAKVNEIVAIFKA